MRLITCLGLQEATQRTIGQFDAAVLEIDTEEAEELARVCAAMQRLRVSACRALMHGDTVCAHTEGQCAGWRTGLAARLGCHAAPEAEPALHNGSCLTIGTSCML